MSFFACIEQKTSPDIPGQRSKENQKESPLSTQSGPVQNEEKPSWYREFMAKPFLYYFTSPPTVNFYTSSYYMYEAPKATVFGDYNQRPFKMVLAVNFGQDFFKNLPESLLLELKNRYLLDKKAVDIAWVIQPLANLGGNTSGSEQNITYLKGHGWTDPEAPQSFRGNRVKRNFLYSLFDDDVDISYEVLLGTMKTFEIHTHNGMYSPQTAAVRLPNAAPDSMALWSLVIDSQNPTGKVRAIATLHWLIAENDYDKFFAESLCKVSVR